MRELIENTEDPRTGRPLLRFGRMLFAKRGPTCRADLPGFAASSEERSLEQWRAWADATEAEVQRGLRELVFDPGTTALVQRFLLALDDGQPLLVEGPPGSGKTRCAQFAASLLGWPLARVSCARDSDKADFLGKYVPDERDGGWRWQDGPATQALREGRVLYLDEVNTARPSLLARLLPLLEVPPSLMLAEHEGEAVPAHGSYRVLATVNSVDEEGRLPLSGPFRDRFVVTFTEDPDEDALEAVIRHLVSGRSEEPVLLDGERFVLPTHRAGEQAFPALGRVLGFPERIPALARFHFELHQRCRDRSIGRDRREPYSFGRRRLLGFLASLEAGARRVARVQKPGVDFVPAFERAFEDHYVRAVQAGSDRDSVLDLRRTRGDLELRAGDLVLARPGSQGSEAKDIEAGTIVVFRGKRYQVGSNRFGTLKLTDGPMAPLSLKAKDLGVGQTEDGLLELKER